MNSWFTNILVCPYCENSLLVKSKVLMCKACGANYQIQKGVPNFLKNDVESYMNSQCFTISDDHPIIKILERGVNQDFNLISDYLNGTLVLDIGTGACFPSAYLAANYDIRCVAVDRSKRALVEYARKTIEYFDTPMHKLSRVIADGYKLPFKKKRFDVILGTSYMHHFKNLRSAFGHWMTFLKDSGIVFSAVESLKPYLRRMKSTSIEDVPRTIDKYRRIFSEFGFSLEYYDVCRFKYRTLQDITKFDFTRNKWMQILLI